MNVNARVGQRIRQLREAMKLSQEDLARALGLKLNAVSRWERGEAKPSIVSLYRVAVFFERPMEYFVKETE